MNKKLLKQLLKDAAPITTYTKIIDNGKYSFGRVMTTDELKSIENCTIDKFTY